MTYDVRVPMRDGVTLSADIYRPDTTEPVPVILVRTPYDNGVAGHVAAGKKWAQRGYAYVVQDVRGRGESDGEFYPLVTEANDGVDTIAWITRQPWSNKRVGMMGGSYLGWVQVYAAALETRGPGHHRSERHAARSRSQLPRPVRRVRTVDALVAR